ncbi:hypothetical protein BDR07DRAFT_1382100 [Suillus spraguei]|nr:hypothetical protein BDR07DRAFT_1382100 [Suillus spraguei]
MTKRNAAGNPTQSGKRPAGTVLLARPITSFRIPAVRAECILDETTESVTYRPPEEIDVIDSDTGETFLTCRVPVIVGRKLKGYIPLPMRYRAVWLQLSYYIVLFRGMWRLWAQELQKAKSREERNNAATLRRTTGTLLAQHMVSRLLAVLELVSRSHNAEQSGEERVNILDEWKIRVARDWFNITCQEVPEEDAKYLKADPMRPENRALYGELVLCGGIPAVFNCRNVEGDWKIEGEGTTFIEAPDDLEEWFDGDIVGLEQMFQDSWRDDALEKLMTPDKYRQVQYHPKAVLPARWHEGQRPQPCFWSVKYWNWTTQGNSPWDKPIDLLYYVLKEDPPYTVVEEFMQDIDTLFNVVTEAPVMEDIYTLARKLWFGATTWGEFVDDLMQNHLRLRHAVSTTSEEKDPENVFDTFEVRLVLEGFVRRNELTVHLPLNERDDVLWKVLKRVSGKHQSAWSWIVSQIVVGKKVTEVLKAAGPWWTNANIMKRIKKVQAPIDGAHNDNRGAGATAVEVDDGDATDDDDDDDAGAAAFEPQSATDEDNNDAAGAASGSGPNTEIQEEHNAHVAKPDHRPKKRTKRTGQSTDDIGMEDDDAMPGSSGEQAQLNSQAYRTSQEAHTNHLSEIQATFRMALNQDEIVIPLQRVAIDQLVEYTTHCSLERYAAKMKSDFSPEHAESVQTYLDVLEDLQVMGPPIDSEAFDDLRSVFREFVTRLVSIEARKEAERRQKDLL